MDKVDAYMERWHAHQRELKEGGATWCLACLEYGHLPEVCPYEDPLFVQAFDRGEVETAEEWIHLKAIPSPQVDQETCLTCLKGEEWCLPSTRSDTKHPTNPLHGRRWNCWSRRREGGAVPRWRRNRLQRPEGGSVSIQRPEGRSASIQCPEGGSPCIQRPEGGSPCIQHPEGGARASNTQASSSRGRKTPPSLIPPPPPPPGSARPIVLGPLGTPVHGRQRTSLDSNRRPPGYRAPLPDAPLGSPQDLYFFLLAQDYIPIIHCRDHAFLWKVK
ncbi:UNVERIFIED_CONTAM: hypothetical protein FKN15_018268 [Acipenser sinensis]